MVRPLRRGGGPGLEPADVEAEIFQLVGKPMEGRSPTLPPGELVSPMWISPRMKVPVVRMTA